MANRQSLKTDIVVVGAGPVGLSLALALAQLNYKVIILEKNTNKFSNDPRTLVLNQSSLKLLSQLCLLENIEKLGCTIDTIVFRQVARITSSKFHANDHSLDYFGLVVAFSALVNTLNEQVNSDERITKLCPFSPSSVQYLEDSIVLSNATKAIIAKLAIAVDGSNSTMLQLLGVHQRLMHSNQQAILAKVTLSDSLYSIACEVFCPDLTLVLIPESNRQARLIQILPVHHKSATLATINKALFGLTPTIVTIENIGGFTLTTSCAEEIIRPRCLVAGNAAQTIHPLLAQGLNLAYSQARILQAILAERTNADPGAWIKLREYQSKALKLTNQTTFAVNLTRKVIDINLPLSPLFCLLNGSTLLRKEIVNFASDQVSFRS